MTLHSDVNYKCEACGAAFIPLVKLQKCPKCGHESPDAFEIFIYATVSSATYNLSSGSFLPGIWGAFTLGDVYYDTAFQFLHFTAASLKITQRELPEKDITEETARSLAAQFVNKVTGIEEYMQDAIQDYLARVLCALKTDSVTAIRNREAFYKTWRAQHSKKSSP